MAAAVWVGLAAHPAGLSRPLEAQEPPRAVAGVQAAAAVEPDTVRVGELFVLGVTVRAAPDTRVAFPPVLALDEIFEQRGPVQLREQSGEDGVQRAYYSLVAWTAGSHTIPAFEIAYAEGDQERRILVQPPSLTVSSVLPVDAEELELRGARPFLRVSGFPWWWLLLLAAALGFGYWAWRRHQTGGVFRGRLAAPADVALDRLERLRIEWTAGALAGGEFFDGLEGALRDYAQATRNWLPGSTLRGLANGNQDLARALKRSMLVRFARLAPSVEVPLEAVDAGVAWVREDSAAMAAEAARAAEEAKAAEPAAEAEEAKAEQEARATAAAEAAEAPADGDVR
jgi:hypothetical protein